MSGPRTVETRQLLLRAPTPADVDALFEVQGDPDAMRHTYHAPDRDATAQYLEAYGARFVEDGFAPWTAVLQEEDRVIGWGGLNRDPGEPQWGCEVAYFIHPCYWGRGLASELVQASLDLAFNRIGLAEVLAFTKPANHRSRQVLQKSGFAFVRHVPELGRDEHSIDPHSWADAIPLRPQSRHR
jgi:RimJ/RimL family protein N-acetyltransferase